MSQCSVCLPVYPRKHTFFLGERGPQRTFQKACVKFKTEPSYRVSQDQKKRKERRLKLETRGLDFKAKPFSSVWTRPTRAVFILLNGTGTRELKVKPELRSLAIEPQVNLFPRLGLHAFIHSVETQLLSCAPQPLSCHSKTFCASLSLCRFH